MAQTSTSCVYRLTPLVQSISESGGTGSFTFESTPPACWIYRTSKDDWITLTTVDEGAIYPIPLAPYRQHFTVPANTGAARTGKLTYFAGTQGGTLQVTINQAGPVATLSAPVPSLLDGVVGKEYPTITLQPEGGMAPFTWTATNLPRGLNLSSSGVLSGTPTESGEFSVKITVTDETTPQQTISVTVPIRINDPLAITTTEIPRAKVGVTYASVPLAAQGGIPPYRWSSTDAPPWLTVSLTGELSAMPTAADTYTFTITASDNSNPRQTASQTLSLAVDSPLTITTSTLKGGIAGKEYLSMDLLAAGGMQPYNWEAAGLPEAMTLSNKGVLGGAPLNTGSFPITLTLRDSSNPPLVVSKELLLTITSELIVATATLPSGAPSEVYPITNLEAQGGIRPYRWDATGLPGGMVLSATGLLSGTPVRAGRFPVNLSVRDSSDPQQTATETLTLTITSGLFISTTALPGGIVGETYPSVSIEAQGGTEPYRWQSNGLPEGLNLGEQGVLSGTPSRAGSFRIELTVTDSSQKTASREFTLTVALPATPSFTVTASGQPTSGAEQLDLTFGSDKPYPLPIDAEFRLTFVPSAAGIPEAGYVSPSLQFVSGGRTAAITVPANSTSLPMPAIQTGDVAGTITVTMTGARVSGTGETLVLPPAPPSTTLMVPRVSPKILPGSVQFIDISPTGFGIQVVATSTPRDLTSVNYNFLARSGTQLSGSSSTVQLGELSKTWFESSSGQGAGGSFVLKVLFPFSGGDPREFIGSVSVSLGNSVGTSGPVSGVP